MPTMRNRRLPYLATGKRFGNARGCSSASLNAPVIAATPQHKSAYRDDADQHEG
ncbi:MAG: hypothetical protein HXY51_16000 [Nitrospirae bacterium]|nr:hypothetical protein [Nitrospirota bacterium]